MSIISNKKFKIILASSLILFFAIFTPLFYNTYFKKKSDLTLNSSTSIENNIPIGILSKNLFNNFGQYTRDSLFKEVDYKILHILNNNRRIDEMLIESYLYHVLNRLLKIAVDIPDNNISIRANRYYCGDELTPIFDITFVNSTGINAFFFGYNHIFVYPGLFKVSPFNEHGLFLTLGHELSHCLCGHSEVINLEIQKTKVNPNIRLASVLNNLIDSNKISRMNEYEADKYGFIMTCRCGFLPRKISNSFPIEKIYETKSNTIFSKKFESLSTHPITSKRVSRFRELYTQFPDVGTSKNSLTFELFVSRFNALLLDEDNFSTKTDFIDNDDSYGFNLKAANIYNNAIILKNNGKYKESLGLLMSNKLLSNHPWGKFLRLELLALIDQKITYSEVEDMGKEFQKFAGEVFKYRAMARIMSLSKNYDKAAKLLESIDHIKRIKSVYKDMANIYTSLQIREKALASEIECLIRCGYFEDAREKLNYLEKISKDKNMDNYIRERIKFVDSILNWKII